MGNSETTMKVLCISPFDSDAPTVINRTLPLLQEATKHGCVIDVVFPVQGNDNFYRRFDKLGFIFLNPSTHTREPSHFISSLGRSLRFLANPSMGKVFCPLGGTNDLEITLRSITRIPNREYDIIYVSKPWLRAVGPGLLLARKWKIPIVLDLDDYDIWHNSYLLRKFQGLVVSSHELKSLFKNYNIAYIPNSTDLTFFDPKKYETRSDQPCIIVWSGMMYESLKLGVVLKAFKLIKNDVKLMFMGRGSARQKLILYSKWLGLEDRVVFREWTDRASVPKSLAKASIGVIHTANTLYERCKCPGKLFEYMAMQIPIVATSVGEPSHVVSEAKCGILVPPEDSYAMAEAMKYLVQNPEIRYEMGVKGREYLIRKQNYGHLGIHLKRFLEQTANLNETG